MAFARIGIVLSLATTLALPELAHARGEPGAADATAAASQPVVPSMTPTAVAPVTASEPATPVTATAPTTETTAPVVTAPAPGLPPASRLPMPSGDPGRAIDKRANGLLAAGGTMVGVTYLGTSLRGAFVIDRARKTTTDANGMPRPIDQRRLAYGRALMVPVIGPFVAVGYTSSAVARFGAVLSGTAQLAGAVMLLAGVIGKGRARRARRIGWSAGTTRGGGGLAIHGRF